jgi:hypothetical protein
MRSRTLETLLLAALVLLPAAATAAAAPPLPRGAEIRVNVSTHGSHRHPVVAVFPDGGFVVVWTNVSVIHARFFKGDGSPESGEFRLTERPEGSSFQEAEGIVADRDGSFLVSWSESIDAEYHVRARRFSRQGAPLGPVVQVDPPGSPGGGSVIALGPRGRFAVAWSAGGPRPATGDYPSTLARIFNADGAPATGAFPVAYGFAGSLAGDDGATVYLTGLVWGPGGTLTAALYEKDVTGLNYFYLARFPSRGGVPSNQGLPESVCCFESQSFGSSRSVALAKAADNSLIAAWPETAVHEEGLKARRLAADGTHLGASFTVAKRPSVLQVKPAIATLADGGFVIVWTENGRDGSGDGIFGRAFAADATPQSRDFRVNVTTAGDQGRPAIAAGPIGTVVVVWESPGFSNVFARLLTP